MEGFQWLFNSQNSLLVELQTLLYHIYELRWLCFNLVKKKTKKKNVKAAVTWTLC